MKHVCRLAPLSACLLLLLSACGGGGGGGSAGVGPPGPVDPGIPSVEPSAGISLSLPSDHGLSAGTFTVVPGGSEELGNVLVSCPAGGSACVVTVAADGTASYDRTGGAPSVISATSVVNVEFRYRADNPSAARLADYFRVFLGGMNDSKSQYREPGFARFAQPPTIRLMDGGSTKQRALLHHAVGLINRELPRHLHLRIGSDAPHIGHVADTSGDANTDSIPNGQMFVYFADAQSAGATPNSGGYANTRFTFDRSKNPWVKQSLDASFVWVTNDAAISEQQRLGILLHEMMHALGFYAHLYSEDHPSSLLGPNGPKGGFHLHWGSQLPEIDGAALRAAYRLPNGITPDRFNISSLDDWETTSNELLGSTDSQRLRFGVNLTNDVAVPWTNGIIPSTELVDNRALSGSVTWNGELLGFTRSLRPVRGNAEIGVNLASLNGTAAFTDIQSWTAGQAPGQIGTGSRWNTGSLNYTLSISGNFLRGTGGDDGDLIGQFYGSSHEGVAGSVERDDLTAAFGAVR